MKIVLYRGGDRSLVHHVRVIATLIWLNCDDVIPELPVWRRTCKQHKERRRFVFLFDI